MNKEPDLSPEQDIAADPARNVWVQANAGTGKTRVLVGRLLRILFRGDDVKNSGILCLTYTNAGAGEMRNRILKSLRAWALASDEELVDLLKDVVPQKPATAADIAHAREVFFWYIDNPEHLKIKTIHSFCEEILRRFPVEAGISPSWSLVSDINQRVLQYEAFERLINASDLEPEKYGRVGGAFEHIVKVSNEYVVSRLLKTISEQYEYFFQVDDTEKYRQYFVDTLQYFLNLNLKPRVDISKSELQNIVDFLDTKIKSEKKPAGYLINALELTKQYINNTIDFEEYKYAYITKTGRTPVAHINKYEILAAEQERVYSIDQYNINTEIYNNTVALFDLSAAFTNIYREMKRQRNLLDFEDLVLYTRKLFSKPDVMGWVLSQLDLSISHILVDEAQDTSPLHWDILQMLMGDFFVPGDTRPEQTSLFVVGDTKQAIYGFTGADSRAFATSRDEIKRQIEENLRKIQDVSLTENYRSLPSILYTVDAFFNDAGIINTTGFHNNPHVAHRNDGTGLVELHKMISKRDDDIDTQQYVSIIADKIKSIVDTGKYKPSDIMVLVQQRLPMVVPLVTALKKRGVLVAGTDKVVLPVFPAIRDLMNMVRFCLDTGDNYSLCCVLKSPIFRLTEADIFDLCKIRNSVNDANPNAPKTTIFAVLKNARPDVYEKLEKILNMSINMAPYSFFSSILDSGARESFISALGPQVIDPLDEFMTLCLSYERTQPGTLRHFLKWFITGGSEIKRDVNASDGVRITTVHSSKGLQAPVVFLIDTLRLPRNDTIVPITPEIMPKNIPDDPNVPTPWLWILRDLPSMNLGVARDMARDVRMAEYYRLLYVGMTRAEEELYIYGHTPDKNPNPKSWHALLWNVLQTVSNASVNDDTIRVVHGK